MFFKPNEDNFDQAFAPEGSKALHDRDLIEESFHFDPDDALLQQKTRPGLYGELIITADDESEGILDKNVFEEVLRLHQEVIDLKIPHLGTEMTYENLCLKWNGACHSSSAILNLYLYNSTMVLNGDFTYPVNYLRTGQMVFFGYDLGGVSGSSSHITSVKSMKLTYNLRYQTTKDIILGEKWEDTFQKRVAHFASANESETIHIHATTSKTLMNEVNNSTMDVLSKFSIAFFCLILFVIGTCAMLDCVRSKPWLACLGILSAALAILSAFGLMTYIGVPFQNIVASSPFLVMGKFDFLMAINQSFYDFVLVFQVIPTEGTRNKHS